VPDPVAQGNPAIEEGAAAVIQKGQNAPEHLHPTGEEEL